MVIRPVQDDDIAAITAITNHYITTTAVHFAYEPLPEAELHAMWLGYRDRFPWLVIEEGGQVAGFAKAGTSSSRTTVTCAGWSRISSRRRGGSGARCRRSRTSAP